MKTATGKKEEHGSRGGEGKTGQDRDQIASTSGLGKTSLLSRKNLSWRREMGARRRQIGNDTVWYVATRMAY